ncbi:hypothetical protein [Ammoniphilus sp. CFH 90114]|uniref:hypothetical protein n=1 Tax=Ammoniphilus sp. CFH 90114 TaxID=2493665 RepID=UPI00100DEB4E|nr:hypothetical protein [Ammoniphilus sp. CFH 90114]RXT03909.1 hypothetical protein EIZ39_22365 [Ammoniphilus sp. CFH 90114]
MKLTNNSFLLISFLIFIFIGVLLQIENISADEYSKFDGSIEATKYALKVETVNDIYFPVVLVVHFILFLLLRYKFSTRR